jgi:sialidase-1
MGSDSTLNRREFITGLAGLSGLTVPIRTIMAEVPMGRANQRQSDVTIRKIKDVVIYRNERFYAAFPSVVSRPDGELIVAFRRAPDRRLFNPRHMIDYDAHTDPNSYLVLVRSHDGGETWSAEPELIYAHPFGGSQDPCLVQLRDGTILCTSYAWMLMDAGVLEGMPHTPRSANYGFIGGYLMKSIDGGHSWKGPILPPPLPDASERDPFGRPLPAFNRGAMCEGRDGRLYWVVAALNAGATATHLLISGDGGSTWEYSCPVARSETVSFNEASLVETPSGELVAFLRTANFDDHTTVARSRDGGRSFEPFQDLGFQGHPHHLAQMEDGRWLMVYGYRHPPYGIRARLLDPECKQIAQSEEITLRSDGGTWDLGYPWATALGKDRALVVYYFNQDDGLRYIGGSILAIGRDTTRHRGPSTRTRSGGLSGNGPGLERSAENASF